jgi:hypothetical protein
MNRKFQFVIYAPMNEFNRNAIAWPTSLIYIVECSALQYMHKNNFRGGFIVTSWIIYKIEAYVLMFQNPKAVKKRPVPKGIKLKKRVR